MKCQKQTSLPSLDHAISELLKIEREGLGCLRLGISSNLVGCPIGMSAGFDFGLTPLTDMTITHVDSCQQVTAGYGSSHSLLNGYDAPGTRGWQ